MTKVSRKIIGIQRLCGVTIALNFALVARNRKTALCPPSWEEVRWGSFSSVFWPLDLFATIKVYFFFDNIKGLLNYNFKSSETFPNYNSPWRVKPGKTVILHPITPLPRWEQHFKLHDILSNFRILVPKVGEVKNITMSKKTWTLPLKKKI